MSRFEHTQEITRTTDRAALGWFVATMVVLAATLGCSAILLVDYVRPSPLFCSSGGCGALRSSGLGWIGPLPLPAIGLAGNAALAVAALVRGPRARVVHLVLASSGAAVAVALIGVQVHLGVFCKYCMVVDIGASVLAALAVVRYRKAQDSPTRPLFVTVPSGALAAVVAAPIAWGTLAPTPVPADVAAEIARTPADQVAVVDYVDYECPFCRRAHADLKPTLDAYKGKLRLVRKNVPLSIHPHAMTAALAASCAQDLGAGEAMAEALVSAPVEQLTDEGCVALAGSLGLDAARVKACMSDPATLRRVSAERDAFSAQGGHGLPTIWFGRERVEGARGPEVLRGAADRAIKDRGL